MHRHPDSALNEKNQARFRTCKAALGGDMAVETIFLSNAFDDERDALADTDTHRAQRETAIAAVTSRAPDMPSGWPSAIAPPFGLTRASSSAMPSWRSTANSWLRRANAS
jgi:hypothetical protein